MSRLESSSASLTRCASPPESVVADWPSWIADVVLLAVKPQQMTGVYQELKGRVDGKLVVSVAAGVTLV